MLPFIIETIGLLIGRIVFGILSSDKFNQRVDLLINAMAAQSGNELNINYTHNMLTHSSIESQLLTDVYNQMSFWEILKLSFKINQSVGYSAFERLSMLFHVCSIGVYVVFLINCLIAKLTNNEYRLIQAELKLAKQFGSSTMYMLVLFALNNKREIFIA